jgi:hypothetical protein
MYNAVVSIMAKFPILVAYAQRKNTNQSYVASDYKLDYV